VPLSYLYHYHLAPPALRARALVERYVPMTRLPVDRIDKRTALASLPPLIKGYLRLGGFVGDGAVIDDQFNTTDVCIIVKTELVTEKYSRHYERKRREAAPG
jgi:putative hemolysin